MRKLLRLTIGIGLLVTVVTACQSGQKQIQKLPDPSFNLSLDSSSMNLMQGDDADVTINLERLDGFTVISGFLENAFFLKKSPSDTSGNKQWRGKN